MSDLQCTKLSYAGRKLRILGKVSTSVQCITNGLPLGNMHFKAHVVEDLKETFNTHSIAGDKLNKKLIGPSQFLTVNSSTEPTTDDDNAPSTVEPRKKRKRRKKDDKKANPAPPPKPELEEPPSPPRPKCQGNWTQHQHGYGGPSGLRSCYEDRRTGEVQYEAPECWDSDGTFHAETSASSLVFSSSSDEYGDNYTNISCVRQNEASRSNPEPNFYENTAPSQSYTIKDLERMRTLRMTGRKIPANMKHIPIPHGQVWCHAGCEQMKDVPPHCGFHPRWGPMGYCSLECPGGWCPHRPHPGESGYKDNEG